MGCKEPNKLEIPEEGNPNYELKKFRKSKPLINLPDDEKAIYIGSNPFIDTVAHITPLVDSKNYILSDLSFEYENKEAKFKDCSVVLTNKDGFKVVEEDPEVSFVMIDQAVNGFKEYCHKFRLGTWLFMHTLFLEPWSIHFYQNRMGVEQSGLHNLLFRKNKLTKREDIILADDLFRILNELDDYSDVSSGFSKHMSFSPYWQKEEQYQGEGFVLGTKDLVNEIEKINPNLNDLEKRILKEQIEKTKQELANKSCRAHNEMKVILEKIN